MTLFDRFIERAQASPKRIILAEGEDIRILKAASMAIQSGVAHVTVLGNKQNIIKQCSDSRISLHGIEIIDPNEDDDLVTYAAELHRVRSHKGMSKKDAQKAILNPLHLGNIMTRMGVCDGSVAGAVYPTSDVVRTALQLIGKNTAYDLVSSFFIMAFDHPFHPSLDVMVFADCALIIDPDAAELAQIAIVSADSAKNFVGLDPRVALLSFSTDGSAEHPFVDKVVAARKLVNQSRPDLKVVGDIQLDAAVIPEILHRKSRSMHLQAPANVLIFPDLDAGNIGYKLAERFGGAQAIGPILQGLNKPANDLSRGCSIEDIYKIIIVTVVQAQNL